MIDKATQQLFEKSFENDKTNLLKLISFILNSEFYEPTLSNPQSPNSLDPLFFDIWDEYSAVLSKLDKDIETSIKSSMNEDFVRILTNYKIDLKGFSQKFELVDNERKLFRKLCISLLKQILTWRVNGSFYEDNHLERVSHRLSLRNYELVKKFKVKYEDMVLDLEAKVQDRDNQISRLRKKTKLIQKVNLL